MPSGAADMFPNLLIPEQLPTKPLHPDLSSRETDIPHNQQIQQKSPSAVPGSFPSTDQAESSSALCYESSHAITVQSPFNWNNFNFFDDLNQSLGIMNPLESEMPDSLHSSNLRPGGLASFFQTSPAALQLNHESELFGNLESNAVNVNMVRSGPSPAPIMEKKLDKSTWIIFKARLEDHKVPKFVSALTLSNQVNPNFIYRD
jgi:hypothetical protein